MKIDAEDVLVECRRAAAELVQAPGCRQEEDPIAAAGIENLCPWIVADRPGSQKVGDRRRREEGTASLPEMRKVYGLFPHGLDPIGSSGRTSSNSHGRTYVRRGIGR